MDDDQAIDGKHCPECRRDIGVWPVLSAGLPDRIWCPYCKTRLTYRIGWFDIMLLVWGIILACGISMSVTAVLGPRGVFKGELVPSELLVQFLLFWALLILIWIPVELVLIRHLRKRGRLQHYSPRSTD